MDIDGWAPQGASTETSKTFPSLLPLTGNAWNDGSWSLLSSQNWYETKTKLGNCVWCLSSSCPFCQIPARSTGCEIFWYNFHQRSCTTHAGGQANPSLNGPITIWWLQLHESSHYWLMGASRPCCACMRLAFLPRLIFARPAGLTQISPLDLECLLFGSFFSLRNSYWYVPTAGVYLF